MNDITNIRAYNANNLRRSPYLSSMPITGKKLFFENYSFLKAAGSDINIFGLQTIRDSIMKAK